MSINDQGNSYQITGPLSSSNGVCGGQTYLSAMIPRPTSDIVTYTFAGQTHTAVRNGNNQIVDTNNAAPQCSATLSQDSVSGGESRAVASAVVAAALAAGWAATHGLH